MFLLLSFPSASSSQRKKRALLGHQMYYSAKKFSILRLCILLLFVVVDGRKCLVGGTKSLNLKSAFKPGRPMVNLLTACIQLPYIHVCGRKDGNNYSNNHSPEDYSTIIRGQAFRQSQTSSAEWSLSSARQIFLKKPKSLSFLFARVFRPFFFCDANTRTMSASCSVTSSVVLEDSWMAR